MGYRYSLGASYKSLSNSLSKPKGERSSLLASLCGPLKKFELVFLGGWRTESMLTLWSLFLI